MSKKSPDQTENAKQGKKVVAKRPQYFVPEVGEVDETQLNLEDEQGKDGDVNN